MAEALDTEDLRLAVYAEFVAGRRPLVADLATSLACRCPPSMRGWPASPRSATSRWAPMARSRWPTRSQRCRWVCSVMGTDRLWWGVGARGTPSPSLHLLPDQAPVLVATTVPVLRPGSRLARRDRSAAGGRDRWRTSSSPLRRCGTTSCGRAATSGSSRGEGCVRDWLDESGERARLRHGPHHAVAARERLVRRPARPRLRAPGAGRRDQTTCAAPGSREPSGDCEAR